MIYRLCIGEDHVLDLLNIVRIRNQQVICGKGVHGLAVQCLQDLLTDQNAGGGRVQRCAVSLDLGILQHHQDGVSSGEAVADLDIGQINTVFLQNIDGRNNRCCAAGRDQPLFGACQPLGNLAAELSGNIIGAGAAAVQPNSLRCQVFFFYPFERNVTTLSPHLFSCHHAK